jgi:hypothetical protein
MQIQEQKPIAVPYETVLILGSPNQFSPFTKFYKEK